MDTAGDGRRRRAHRTVDRVAALLEAAVLHPEGASLTQLARRVGAPVSSVQKLVDGLVAVGFLDEAGLRYTLGPAPTVLSLRAGRPRLPGVRHADLEDLHRVVGAPVLLAVRLGDAAVYVDWAGADEAFDFALAARLRTPLLDTAAGRLLLAHLPEGERRGVVATLCAGDPAGAVDALAEAAVIRTHGRVRGLSGPLVPDADAVAVPLRDGAAAGPVVAAVVVTLPAGAAPERLEAAGGALEAAAVRWGAPRS